MKKKVTYCFIQLFFLLALISAEAGWIKSLADKNIQTSAVNSDWDRGHSDDLPTDAEEDNTETREIDEYDSQLIPNYQQVQDPLLNLHYTFQHLLFKEHFRELIVPPPKA
jgi:hypothetical protein